jgi:hypothetical protein
MVVRTHALKCGERRSGRRSEKSRAGSDQHDDVIAIVTGHSDVCASVTIEVAEREKVRGVTGRIWRTRCGSKAATSVAEQHCDGIAIPKCGH